MDIFEANENRALWVRMITPDTNLDKIQDDTLYITDDKPFTIIGEVDSVSTFNKVDEKQRQVVRTSPATGKTYNVQGRRLFLVPKSGTLLDLEDFEQKFHEKLNTVALKFSYTTWNMIIDAMKLEKGDIVEVKYLGLAKTIPKYEEAIKAKKYAWLVPNAKIFEIEFISRAKDRIVEEELNENDEHGDDE